MPNRLHMFNTTFSNKYSPNSNQNSARKKSRKKSKILFYGGCNYSNSFYKKHRTGGNATTRRRLRKRFRKQSGG